MQTMSAVSGFTELKDLLIRTYNIDRPKEEIRLWFTVLEDLLIMHDYQDHQKSIVLINSIQAKAFKKLKLNHATELLEEALETNKPDVFLNDGFLLHGFFRTK